MRPTHAKVPADLWSSLEAETAAERNGAERAVFLQHLFECASDCGVCGHYLGCVSYVQFLRAWRDVYACFERALWSRLPERLKALRLPELRRLEDVERDLSFLAGAQWGASTQPSPAATRYVERLEQLSSEAPWLLAAHAYVRYRTDVLGGHLFGGLIASALKLDPPNGVSFYLGGLKGPAAAGRQRLREAIDSIELEVYAAELVVEARFAYRLNLMLLNEASRLLLGCTAIPS